MISPALRQTLDRIRPLLDRNLVQTLAGRWDDLPKRPTSLGRIEDLVIHYGLIRGVAEPALQRTGLYVFAADHGIVQEGISDVAQDATRRMAMQFLRGGSPVQVLCRMAQIEPVLVNAGVRGAPIPGALNYPVQEGSANMAHGPALTEEAANAALELGLRMAEEAAARFDAVGLGQIGVGGSAAAGALLCAATGRDAAETVNRIAGIDDQTHTRRVAAVRAAVNRNQLDMVSPFGALRSLGGLDLAAMTGFLLGAAARRLPVFIDGFIAGAAVISARAFAPDSLDAFIFSHREPEHAHAILLRLLAVEPVFDLHLREGEGFAAAFAIQLLRTGIRLLEETRDLSGS